MGRGSQLNLTKRGAFTDFTYRKCHFKVFPDDMLFCFTLL